MSLKNAFVAGSDAKRLPKYFRCLRRHLMNGDVRISSGTLAEQMGITPSQVRADLNGFSGTGQQGYGYSVKALYTEISRELGVADGMRAVLICDPSRDTSYLVERLEGRGITVTDVLDDGIDTYGAVKNMDCDIAVVLDCADMDAMSGALATSLIKGVWNMTTEDMELDIPVMNMPIGDVVMSLMYEIRHNEGRRESK